MAENGSLLLPISTLAMTPVPLMILTLPEPISVT